MLQELDASIGELLLTLDRLGLAKNTLILYSSDNGAYHEKGHRPTGPFRGKKSQLWEGGVRVPFIVRWPARIQPGISTDLVHALTCPPPSALPQASPRQKDAAETATISSPIAMLPNAITSSS